MAHVLSVATAVPPHCVSQQEARRFASRHFAGRCHDLAHLLPVFDNAHVETRYFSVPPDWFDTPKSFAERNRTYVQAAVDLGEQAVARAVDQAGLALHDIHHLFFVSSTGISAPSIDARLINRMPLRADICRTPIWGLGCAGGVAGLARAFDFAMAYPDRHAVIVALELCGLAFQPNDISKSNIIATCLFGEGAAAAVVGPRGERKACPRILAHQSVLWPDSLDVMGWHLTEDGLNVVFSRDIPTIVKQQLGPLIHDFLARQGLEAGDISHYITHPGGTKVIEAFGATLGLPFESMRHPREVLRRFGNMSSASVLFVLREEWEHAEEVRPGDYGLLSALGPGFSAELLLIRWDDGATVDRERG